MEGNGYVSPDNIRGKPGEIKFIQDFLKSKEGTYDVSESGFPFVTISRESSAGGHLLSHVLMTDFLKQNDPSGLFRDWHIFDRQLCETIAQDTEMHNSVSQLLTEKYHSEFKDYIDSLFTGYSDKYTIHKTTSRIIHMLAAIGKVIIVCANACCITRDLKAGIHIRLVAPEPKRVAWMMKRFNMNKTDAQKAVDEQDASQRKSIDKFFNKDVRDPLLYDIVWNTARVEMHEISHSIIDMIRIRARKPQRNIVAPDI
ncbi:MAG: cytidylate kinase family protein [Kiritimatiellae bacterium]|nr:cytidylate kinase family protein [Kiritimatiellia bacterium]MDD5520783.1 cytidylate kinase family protein [Kiritimatiellia bacterium]